MNVGYTVDGRDTVPVFLFDQGGQGRVSLLDDGGDAQSSQE